MSDDCIFCKIVAAEIPSIILSRRTGLLHSRTSQQAPVHILIVPNQHFNDVGEMGDAQAEILGRIMQVASQLAVQQGAASEGWRLVTNVGRNGGQEVFHTHFHLLGGRPLGPLLTR